MTTSLPEITRELMNAMQTIHELRDALRFYADPARYEGPNQRLVNGEIDRYAPEGLPYRLDVTRDRGEIARAAIAKAGG